MRVGIISPNLIDSIDDEYKAWDGDPSAPWALDEIGKRAALIFDKIYLTDDLETTFDIIQYICPEERLETLFYLQRKGVVFSHRDLGYASAETFFKANVKGAVAKIQAELMRVGNPGLDGEPDDFRNIGHPDVGDYAAQNGMHPRSCKGWSDPKIKVRKRKYESLLLRRNAAMLREAGVADVAIIGRLYEERRLLKHEHPVWRVVFKEMPRFDTRAPWDDVLDFRAEERTQHLIRSLRRWVRKVVAEEWSENALEDEVRELVYEYETHLRLSRMSNGKEALEFLVTGTADLVEDIIKLRFGKIAQLATAMMNRHVRLLQAEAAAPGRELALIPELKRHF